LKRWLNFFPNINYLPVSNLLQFSLYSSIPTITFIQWEEKIELKKCRTLSYMYVQHLLCFYCFLIVKMAGDIMVSLDFLPSRFFLSTNFHSYRATRAKDATAWRIDRARQIALENDPLTFFLNIRIGDRDG